MKKRALCAVLCLALCIVLGGQAFAAESGVSILVNETALAPTADVLIEERTTYVSYLPVVLMLYPEATAVWENGHAW